MIVNTTSQIQNYNDVTDDFFVAQDIDLDIGSKPTGKQNVQSLARLFNLEHSYDTVSKSKEILFDLNYLACLVLYREDMNLFAH